MTKRSFWWIATALVAAAVLYGAWHWSAWRHRAWIAAGFGARVACSCRYVEGRGIDGCRSDLVSLPGMGLVHLSEDTDTRTIAANVPFLAHRAAHVQDGFGCLMDAN